jgi:hypothetical protein
MKIKCAYKEILDIDDPKIIPNPNNPNDHGKEQIKLYAKILKYQGQRKPIVISKQSGFMNTGHGMLLAAKQAGAKKIAVDFQDFDNDAQEYANAVADNALALQSELDRSKINDKFPDFGPDFDLDYLGMEDFKLDPIDFDVGTEEDQGKLDEKKPLITQCPNCGECFDANENKPKN